MGLTLPTQYVFGGVDSRSNPLNFPSERSLRCLNWVPKEAGYLELRYGYAVTNQVTAAAGRIVNFTSYKTLAGTRMLVYFDGTTPKVMNLATGVVTTPTVRGAAFASAAKGQFQFVNNRLTFCNGTDIKWFDGTTWRDVGVRAPTAGEAAAVGVADGSADPTNGIAASTVGGAQPGYQLWMAYYNPTTGDISNALAIGSRIVNAAKDDFNLTGLPNLSGVDTELVKLIGRTGDGAETPYACADTAGNWFTVANAATTGSLNVPNIDGNAEMPSRNSQPIAFDKICLAGDYVYGNAPNSPTIYRSGSALLSRQGTFPGNPDHCFAANDIETIPTNQAISCMKSYNQDAWAYSLTDMAILASDQTGVMGWQGPWNKGCAGSRAWIETPYGPYWVSGEKELCTMTANGPISVSEEYELALLSQIGDANLGTTEVKYIRDISKGVDQVVINCLDSNGNPFHVIHDFKLKDGRNALGQAYTRTYASILSTAHSVEMVRDANDKLKLWAGGSDGKLYELYNGANDNGAEFAADFITIVNAGVNRPSVDFFAWFGDQNLQVSIGRKMKSQLDPTQDFAFENLNTEAMPSGGQDDFYYKAKLTTTEMRNCFIRLQLSSHSADGNLNANNPIHIPLESYGRVFAAMPAIGNSRGN